MAQPLQKATQSTSPRPPKKSRPDWMEPALTAVVFGLFVLYSLWETLFHNNGVYGNYVSPFFSPQVGKWFGFKRFNAIPVVWVPFLFRATCYYYRKEYNRGWFWHPRSCATNEVVGRKYTGESRFPFSGTNLHRYFWYLAVIVLVFLWKDTVQAFFFSRGFQVHLGSVLMLINAIFLTLYTFSCHAFRHLVGGGKDCYSCAFGPNAGKPTTSYSLWIRVSRWNQRHGSWAWLSLFSVLAVDLYIRLLIVGVIHDVRFF
jgi:hypothetical protein